MSIEDFCAEASKSPLFKKSGLTITPDFLKKADFALKESDFFEADLLRLHRMLEERGKRVEEEKWKREPIPKAAASLIAKNLLMRSPIDFMEMLPKFRQWVAKIRKKYGIKPEGLKKERESILKPGEKMEALESKMIPLADAVYLRDLIKEEKQFMVDPAAAVKVRSWEKKKFLLLDVDIFDFIQKRTRLPPHLHKVVRDYLLYGDRTHALFTIIGPRRPAINIELDDEMVAPCITLKIYADTSKNEIKAALKRIDKLKWQKLLGKKFSPGLSLDRGVFRRMKVKSFCDELSINHPFFKLVFWYLLRNTEGAKDANRDMEHLGFETIEYGKNDKKLRKNFEKIWLK